jgi:hypothetical protein
MHVSRGGFLTPGKVDDRHEAKVAHADYIESTRLA